MRFWATTSCLLIKRAEDILEKYWNAHRMDTTLEWLFAHHFASPFDFFQEFGNYWEAKGWARLGHQLEDLFTRLYDFLSCRQTKDMDHILTLMKFDFLSNQKHRPRRLWWEDVAEKKEMQSIFVQVQKEKSRLREDFATHAELEKDYFKHTVVTHVSFDVEHWMKTGNVINGDFALVVYYPYKESSSNTFVVVERPTSL